MKRPEPKPQPHPRPRPKPTRNVDPFTAKQMQVGINILNNQQKDAK